MDRFLTCLIDKDLTALLRSGKASELELQQAWLVILSEYNELKSDDPNASEHWKLSCEIIRLNHHLNLTQYCIDFLSHTYSEGMKENLRRLGYKLKNTTENPVDYWKELVRIANQAKTKHIEIKQLTKQLNALLNVEDKNKPNRSIYDSMLIQFEEMQHTTYDMTTLTVSKFIYLEKKYNDYVERLKQQAERNKERINTY